VTISFAVMQEGCCIVLEVGHFHT